MEEEASLATLSRAISIGKQFQAVNMVDFLCTHCKFARKPGGKAFPAPLGKALPFFHWSKVLALI